MTHSRIVVPDRSRLVLPLFAATIALVALAGCSSAAPAPGGTAASTPLSPLYNVTPAMQRPDGTLLNGLMPEDPNDQS